METERIVEKSIFTEPTFDVHFHCGRPHDFEETIGIIKKEMEIIGLKKVLLLSLSFHTPAKHDYDQNLRCLAYKNLFDGAVYASASLKQNLALTDEEASDDYLKQAETYYDAGFDGMKFLEGHPSFIKLFGHLTILFNGMKVARPAFEDLRSSIQVDATCSSSTTILDILPPTAISIAVEYSSSTLPSFIKGA